MEKEKRSTSRMPSLDGLRAISIVLVLLGHLHGTAHFPRFQLPIGDCAHLGVVIFFVISGFLITTLLMEEVTAHGRISLKLFYARRALRIFPASYAYIFVMALLTVCSLIHLTAPDMLFAVSYAMNYLPDRSWQVGHLWSLSVEEQFYLLWPFAFAFLKPRKRMWIVAGVMLFAVVSRVCARLFLMGTRFRDLEMFPMVADSLAAGCCLALMRVDLEAQNWYRWLLKPLPSLACLFLVLLLNRYQGYTVDHVFGTVLINLGLAVLIHRSVVHANAPVGKFLNWRPVKVIGVLSYSLYLWQQPFLDRSSSAWINAFPQNVIVAIVVALTSYWFLEKPLLVLRSRLRSAATVETLPVSVPV